MNYKIVASDLDGTLLNNNSDVSDKNISAIREMCENDVLFAPSTGRTFSEIPDKITDIEGIRYFIYSNGAVLYDRYENKKYFSCIDNKQLKTIYDVLSGYEVHISIRHNGQLFVDASLHTEQDFKKCNLSEPHRTVVMKYGILTSDFKNVTSTFDNTEAVSVFFADYNNKLKCEELLHKHTELNLTGADKFNLEILSADAGKGNCIKKLADITDVDISQTIAVGDSENDISALSVAGTGLAVSNACDSLKSAADKIICSNEENVADYIMQNYIK